MECCSTRGKERVQAGAVTDGFGNSVAGGKVGASQIALLRRRCEEKPRGAPDARICKMIRPLGWGFRLEGSKFTDGTFEPRESVP